MYKNTIVKHIVAKTLQNKIYYGAIETPDYGKIFAAYSIEETNLYIFRFQFKLNQSIEMFVNDLQKLWPNNQLVKDEKLAKKVFANYITEQKENQEVFVVLNATDFQTKVWSALVEIPFGEECTYGEVAAMIGNPKAARAVGNAVASNNIVIFIPCHRVKATINDMHKYSSGSDLKKKILLNEQKRK